MIEPIKQVLYQAGSYALLVLIIFFFFNILSNGFFLQYIRAKGSFGRLVLVTVFDLMGRHYRTGKLTDTRLRYKGRDGKFRSHFVKPGQVLRTMSVNSIDIDETSGKIINRDFTGTPAFDAVKIDSAIERALALRNLTMDKLQIAIILLVIIIALASAFTAFNIVAIKQMVGAIPITGVI